MNTPSSPFCHFSRAHTDTKLFLTAFVIKLFTPRTIKYLPGSKHTLVNHLHVKNLQIKKGFLKRLSYHISKFVMRH